MLDTDRNLNREDIADLLNAIAHTYVNHFIGPVTLGYLFLVPLLVISLTPVTVEYVRTWQGMVTIVFGPLLLVNGLMVYGWLLSDLIKHTTGSNYTHYETEFE